MDKRVYLAVAALVVFAAGALYIQPFMQSQKDGGNAIDFDRFVTVYKTKYCGCCEKYILYLTEKGFSVRVVNVENLEEKYSELGVPKEMYSCHISEIGGYFVVGHVPVEAVEKLLKDKPGIDGIALPGMPPGSPGMPGKKQEEFLIFALSDGVAKVYLRL